MIRRNYSNTATATTLTAGINSSVTSLTVASASGYPDAPFTIRCESEIILVGAKSGTTFSSLTRGYDGTTAAAHSTSAVVEHRAIRDDFSYRWLDPVADKTATQAENDHFDNDTIASAWVQVTPTGTCVWTEGRDLVSAKYNNQTSNDVCGLIKPLGVLSYPVVLTTAIRLLAVPSYGMAGLLFSDGSTSASNVIWAMTFWDTNSGFVHSFRTGTFTNINSIIITERRAVIVGPFLYQRMIWRALNTWSLELSPDGVSWTDYANGNETFALTPTHFGLGATTWGGTVDAITSYEYFNIATSLP